jgi:small subunit ribosomal protein S9
VPGAHLEVDIVPEGVDPLGRGEEEYADPYALEGEDEQVAVAEAPEAEGEPEEPLSEPIATAAIDLAAGARYHATGKRKTAIARVTLRPGSGAYLVNGRTLEEHFPRTTLQRNIRQPLETVGYHERMDVVARLHGGGISAQAGALRHGVSRALLEADPNLRGELKRRGFLTRDSRAKERKKAGLKKARKRPQFSKR